MMGCFALVALVKLLSMQCMLHTNFILDASLDHSWCTFIIIQASLGNIF